MLLSAVSPTYDPIQIGTVYYEDASGFDEAGDVFEITFTGGAPGTQLTQLIIETDKLGDGLTIGDCLFDTAAGGLGAFQSVPLSILASDGIDSVETSVFDGGTTLTLTFTGFEAGDRLRLTLDVDEQGFLGPNAVAEGNEFEGSQLLATFTAPHYYTAAGSDIFIDDFDSKLSQSGLDLPNDAYVPPNATSSPVRTAAAIFALQQEPLPITLSGTVFEDLDRDNTQDSGDLGIAGVKLSLLQLTDTGYVATGQTTTTDADGHYAFEGLLPGTYRVVETQPSGYLSVGARAGTVEGLTRGDVASSDVLTGIALLGGEDSVANDFAEVRPASISGRVIADMNANCTFDAGDTYIEGVTVNLLDASGNVVSSRQTDADGRYEFSGLVPGVYGVAEIQPAGYLDACDHPGSAGGSRLAPDSIVDVTLGSGTVAVDYNFMEVLPASISGYVYVDQNNNGVKDSGEAPIAGAKLALLDADGNPTGATTTTDAAGYYVFDNLRPGRAYGVAETQPAGYWDGLDAAGTAGGTAQNPGDKITGASLAPGVHAKNYNFGELPPASISGYVYVDQNNNGVKDFGEVPIAGAKLALLDADGNPTGATTVTDAAGYYVFDNLRPGRAYGVAETQPADYWDGLDAAGTAGGTAQNPGDKITGALLAPGVHAKNYNFGELPPASISGYVYVDQNNDGVKNFGETPIAGVTLALLDAAGNPTGRTTTTDAAGYYVFDNLAPTETYGVAETQPTAYLDGLDAAGTAGGTAQNPGDKITGALLAPGTNAKNYNFGELLPASVAGRVFADMNSNNALDSSDRLLGGVTIYLVDASGARVATTTTNARGEYLFTNLRPGAYAVEEVQPAGYFDGSESVGSEGGYLDGNDRLAGIVLASGTAAVEYNFGELLPASISGYVFQDGGTIRLGFGQSAPDPATVRDGVFTSDDKPIAGVRLTLGDASGAPIPDANGNPIVAVTNANGYYEFTNLQPGVYTVLETQPQNYIDSLDTPGSKGGIAVNPSQPVSEAILQTLAVDPKNDAILRIVVASGDAAVSYNFSEVRVEDAPPWFPPERRDRPASPPDRVIMPGIDSLAPVPHYLPGPTQRVLVPLYGGGILGAPAYTWHLSVVNGGRPRRDGNGDGLVAEVYGGYFNPVSWSGAEMNRSQWLLADSEGRPSRQFQFGLEGGIPVAGDFNGDGVTEVGVFLDGIWFLDLNGNGIWDEGDLWAKLGDAGDMPVVGDWDGDGKDDIGIFGRAWEGDPEALAVEPGLPDAMNKLAPHARFKNIPPAPDEATTGVRTMKRTSLGEIRSDVIDHVFRYGVKDDVAVAGDWNGDGVSNIGLFRGGVWFLDADGDGRWSSGDVYIENFGSAGDLPVVGDWNGDGIDDLGIYHGGIWQLDSDGDRALSAHDAVLKLGGPHDKPVAGDFNGDGIDEPALYRDGVAAPDPQAAAPGAAPAATADAQAAPGGATSTR